MTHEIPEQANRMDDENVEPISPISEDDLDAILGGSGKAIDNPTYI